MKKSLYLWEFFDEFIWKLGASKKFLRKTSKFPFTGKGKLEKSKNKQTNKN